LDFSRLINPHAFLPELAATTVPGVLEEMAGAVCMNGSLSRESVLRVLLERERLGSTAIGGGVALPHGKLRGLKECVFGLARSRQGVDFGAEDRQPARLFFLLLSPEGAVGAHLAALAAISRLLAETGLKRELLEAADGFQMAQALLRAARTAFPAQEARRTAKN